MITTQQVFDIKQNIQSRIEAAERELQELIQRQHTLTAVDQLAVSLLQYEAIEERLEQYSHAFTFFSTPVQALLSPFVKSELLESVRSITAIDPDLGATAARMIVEEVRMLAQSPEDDTIDMVESEYKVYILPALLLAGLYTEVNDCMREMVRWCTAKQSSYGSSGEAAVALQYACEIAIDMSSQLDGLIQAIRVSFPQWLSEADQAFLLDACEERLAELRFEVAQRQTIAHEKAVSMLEQREKYTQ